MRTRITTLVLSGLASATLVLGAGHTAYASSSVNHGIASESAAAQGEWVDNLLRLAGDRTGFSGNTWTFTGRSILRSDTPDPADPESTETTEQGETPTEQGDSVQAGEDGAERGRPMGEPSALGHPEGPGAAAAGGEACKEGAPGQHGLSECACPPGEHGGHEGHGEHGEHGEHGGHEGHGEHGEHGEHGGHEGHGEHGEHGEH
ncbi:hypothetical protein ABTY56_22765, partial [Kitasatospora sp. NPDC097691]